MHFVFQACENKNLATIFILRDTGYIGFTTQKENEETYDRVIT